MTAQNTRINPIEFKDLSLLQLHQEKTQEQIFGFLFCRFEEALTNQDTQLNPEGGELPDDTLVPQETVLAITANLLPTYGNELFSALLLDYIKDSPSDWKGRYLPEKQHLEISYTVAAYFRAFRSAWEQIISIVNEVKTIHQADAGVDPTPHDWLGLQHWVEQQNGYIARMGLYRALRAYVAGMADEVLAALDKKNTDKVGAAPDQQPTGFTKDLILEVLEAL